MIVHEMISLETTLSFYQHDPTNKKNQKRETTARKTKQTVKETQKLWIDIWKGLAGLELLRSSPKCHRKEKIWFKLKSCKIRATDSCAQNFTTITVILVKYCLSLVIQENAFARRILGYKKAMAITERKKERERDGKRERKRWINWNVPTRARGTY